MYEDRVVAFVDILGFSGLVRSSESNVENIVAVVENMQRISKESGMDDEPEYGFTYDRKVSVFSDNIVISYRNEGPAEYYLVRELMILQTALLSRGVNVRGGVTMGKLLHNDSIVIGPALIRAYELESKVAVYPRIIFDETSQTDWCMLAEDYDGVYFIDFLGNAGEWSYYIEHTEGIEPEQCLEKILTFCTKDNNMNDLRIKAKLDWMKLYVKESIVVEGLAKPRRQNSTTYKRSGRPV